MDASQWAGVALVLVPILGVLIFGLVVDFGVTVQVLGVILVAFIFSGVITYGLALTGWLA